MMSYQQLVEQDQRLLILQALHEDADYSHNEYILQEMLGGLGHSISSDRLRTELQWLSEQGLVAIEAVSDVVVARVTRRGEDVALGRSHVPGVRRPKPGR